MVAAGSGATWFDVQPIKQGARFIAAWFDAGYIKAAFHVEEDQPMGGKRTFAICPMHFSFDRPLGTELIPLGGVQIPNPATMMMFTLYEAIDVIRTEQN